MVKISIANCKRLPGRVFPMNSHPLSLHPELELRLHQDYLDFHRSARAKLLEQATKSGYKGQGEQSFSTVKGRCWLVISSGIILVGL